MGVCNCSMFCCTLLYVHSSIAIILMGKRELIALLNLSSWCLVMVEWLFLAVPRGCLQFVIVVFPDHTHLLFLATYSGTESMLAVRENAVLVHVLHDIANDDVFQHLTAKAGQRNRAIVGWVVSLAFLEHFRSIGCFPVFWDGFCL